jgi:hypothetical protein
LKGHPAAYRIEHNDHEHNRHESRLRRDGSVLPS